MFQSLEYDSILLLGLSSWNSIGFDIDFGRWVEHKNRKSGLKEDNQEQKVWKKKSEIL